MIQRLYAQEEKPYFIQEMNSKSGLFMEEIGNIKTYNENWKIITHINMSEYKNQYYHIKEVIEKVTNICGQLKPFEEDRDTIYTVRGGCGPILEQIHELTEGLETQSVKWFIKENRKKRGLMNIIGTITKGLFGILNEDDAKQYIEQFRDLQGKSLRTNRIVEEHTTLLQSLIDLARENDNKLTQQATSIENQIKTIEEQLIEMTDDTYKFIKSVALKRNVQMMIDYVMLLLINFQNKQKHFIDIVSVGHKSQNSPLIIPPNTFLDELKQIEKDVENKNLYLPMKICRENLASFYQITTPEIGIINDQLLIAFTVPLVKKENYTLFKVNSLPVRWKENLYTYIIPTYEFIALDTYLENYLSFSTNDIENCHHAKEKDLVCKETSPIIQTKMMDNCEINFIKNINDTNSCNIRIGKFLNEIWIKLRQQNTWLFILPQKQNIFINCKNYFENLSLKDTGIINIAAGCQVKTVNILISAFKTTESVKIKQIFPEINWKNRLNEIEDINITDKNMLIMNNIKPSVIGQSQAIRLSEISLGLEKIKELEKENRNYDIQINTKNKIGFLQILIFILFGLFSLMIVKVIIFIILNKVKRQRFIIPTLEKQEDIKIGETCMETDDSKCVEKENDKLTEIKVKTMIVKEDEVHNTYFINQ